MSNARLEGKQQEFLTFLQQKLEKFVWETQDNCFVGVLSPSTVSPKTIKITIFLTHLHVEFTEKEDGALKTQYNVRIDSPQKLIRSIFESITSVVDMQRMQLIIDEISKAS